MPIEGVEDVEDEEGLIPGRKRSYQDQDRGQMKDRLTKESILLDQHKGPRSSYASNGAPSALRRLLLALLLTLLLLIGTTKLDTCLLLPGLPAVDVVQMEVPVLPRLERTSALWMRAGESLATRRFREVLFLDVRLPQGFVEEPLQSQGRREVRLAETPGAETRRSESVGIDGGSQKGQSIEVR